MRNLILCVITIFIGCHKVNTERLYYKYIQTPSITVEWFFYSTVSNTTPDYVIVNSHNIIDTICIADNIIDVNLDLDTIKIFFNGTPKEYGKPISIKENKEYYFILVDSVKRESGRPMFKDFFKR